MKCPNCGHKLKKGMVQCPSCGMMMSPSQSNSADHKKILITLICISGVFAAALIVFAVILVQNIIIHNNYIKRLSIFKNELQKVQADIDDYADSVSLGEDDRDLVAVCDIFEEDAPSLLYVVEGQDEEERPMPVIRICDVENDTVQTVYESSADQGPVDYISILQNSETGEVYLFSDYETPENGRVAICSLHCQNKEILQEELFRLTYQWQTENDENAYRYEYFINGESTDEEAYQNGIEAFVASIDRVILSGRAGTRTLKYNYFRDIASVSMSVEDAVGYLDDGISGATPDEAIASPDEVKKEARQLVEIDPSDVPESLTRFLQIYDFGYSSGYEDRILREFDCDDLSVCNGKLVTHIAGNPSCVDGALYPGENAKEIWNVNADPLKKFSTGGTLEYPKEKLLWIMQNVFHVSATDAQELLQADLDADPDFYEYEKDGKVYLYRKIGGVGGPGFDVSYQTVRFDGEKYYIVYDCLDAYTSYENSRSQTYYAEFSEKEYDGQKYWSLYRHTENIPTLPEADNTPSGTEIFSLFEGEYLFTSGIGGWGTTMTLNPDGTFSGEYSDYNMGEDGDGYDSTVYYSKFSGTFKNPQRINAYTYSFELGDIQYENTPKTEEIKTPENADYRLRTVYSVAYGLDTETGLIYAYTPEAPVSQTPDKLITWIGMQRGSSKKYSPKLSHRCLYVDDKEYGWMEREKS